ncbi:MAG: gamma-glutamyltransferase [Candidatus Omnitrophica bacterium]|nr:gamma-glutamyltransferase [Candidatus Omnitrophota bacterium]
MVVTANSHATRAAFEILQDRGNAVDAAIAAQWVLNIVEPQSSGIGGGGFFLYYEAATKRIYTFDGRETAPQEVYPEIFLEGQDQPVPFKPNRITGGRPVGVPGTLALLQEVHERFGTKRFSFSGLLNPAIEIAERGFPVSKRLAYFLNQEKERLALFEASRGIFLKKDGSPYREGEILLQKDIAKTFRLIQQQGMRVFYEGEIAEAIVQAVRNSPVNPGLMKREDLAHYHAVERMPVHGRYRNYDVFSMGPPSSGGVTLIEILNILENFQLDLLGRTPNGVHVFLEAQKLAFEDRNEFLGDPDFVEIPIAELLSKPFAEKKTQEINYQTAVPTGREGIRTLMLEPANTTHLSIVDGWGNMVSFTSTIEEIFGSAMVVPGYGFVLNNELTDFDAEPTARRTDRTAPQDQAPDRRSFKRRHRMTKRSSAAEPTGAESKKSGTILKPNAPEGGKRPRSSMTPTFVFNGGKPVLVLGSPGGSAIIGTVLNLIVNLLDFGMPATEAMKLDRMIHRGEEVELESALFRNQELKRELMRRGHRVMEKEAIGNAQMIYFDPEENIWVGVSDPRGEGEALGR